MLKIYFADSDFFQKEYSLDTLLSLLPESLHAKARRYRRSQDAFNFVLGRLMLQRGLEEMGLENDLENDLEKIEFNKNGKPILENIFFNISHSANIIVCAITQKCEIGIDVESERAIQLEEFKSSFTEKEWVQITQHAFPVRKFYWYWVRKESIIKALGVTLNYLNRIEIAANENSFSIKNENENAEESEWFLKDLHLNVGDENQANCYFALCSKEEFTEVKILEFSI